MLPGTVLAAAGAGEHSLHFGSALLPLALLIFGAVIFASIARKWGQSPVLAQLTAGIVIATILIAVGGALNTDIRQVVLDNPFVDAFAQLGVMLLLLNIGMHSNVQDMRNVGAKALGVAIIGVILPIIAGIGMALLFDIGNGAWTVILFLAAAKTATSVALSVSVLEELGLADSKEGKVVQGAAVIDDILGLILLAMVAGMATSGGSIDGAAMLVLFVKALAFVVLSLWFGGRFADFVSRVTARFVKDIEGEILFVFLLTLVFGGVSFVLGLEPIIGAFAAGLLLEEVHLERFNSGGVVKVEKIVKWFMVPLVPLFFARVGMLVDVTILTPKVLLIGGVISIAAIASKYVAGYAARGMNHAIIGWSMVPRGEIGLVFAAKAALGVFSGEEVAIILTMVIVTTFVAPYGLRRAAKKAAANKVLQTV